LRALKEHWVVILDLRIWARMYMPKLAGEYVRLGFVKSCINITMRNLEDLSWALGEQTDWTISILFEIYHGVILPTVLSTNGIRPVWWSPSCMFSIKSSPMVVVVCLLSSQVHITETKIGQPPLRKCQWKLGLHDLFA
jgi:hypothetical protein